MFRNKIMEYFLNKSLKCLEKRDWKGWRRYFTLAWKITDKETQEALRPVIVQWLDDQAEQLQSMLKA